MGQVVEVEEAVDLADEAAVADSEDEVVAVEASGKATFVIVIRSFGVKNRYNELNKFVFSFQRKSRWWWWRRRWKAMVEAIPSTVSSFKDYCIRENV